MHIPKCIDRAKGIQKPHSLKPPIKLYIVKIKINKIKENKLFIYFIDTQKRKILKQYILKYLPLQKPIEKYCVRLSAIVQKNNQLAQFLKPPYS